MTALAGLGLVAAITIAVAGPPTSPEYLPLFVAQSEGYFAQEKLDVTLATERSEGDAAQAMAAGHADIVATSLDAAYRLGHVHGAPPLLLFGLTAAPPVAILVSPSQRETVRSLRDLRGQTVGVPGVGTPEQAMLTAALTRAGVAIHQVPIRSFSRRSLVGALEQGEVAAAVMADPWVTRLVADGAATILADFRTRSDAARWLGVETVHAAVFLRADAVVAEQDLVALARALLRATARVSDGPAEALAVGLRASVIGRRDDFVLRLDGARESYLPRGLVTEGMLKASLRQARERAEMPVAVKLPWFRWSPLLLTGPLERASAAGDPSSR